MAVFNRAISNQTVEVDRAVARGKEMAYNENMSNLKSNPSLTRVFGNVPLPRTFEGLIWVLLSMILCSLLGCDTEKHTASHAIGRVIGQPDGAELATSASEVIVPEEVVFWHFWGGPDRAVVDGIAAQFNASQSRFRVRAIPMPGNNLQAKLFLSVAGGDPPDLVNQDDPVLADWAQRGVIAPFSDFASKEEIEQVSNSLVPAAAAMSNVDGELWGLCNGLDIRALYYNRTALEHAGLSPPSSIEELDRIAERLAPPLNVGGGEKMPATVGFLPDTRRFWAWAPVFGGRFYDEATGALTIDDPQNRAALQWMAGYRQRYGADNLAAFRQGDQSLPGKTFPLLPLEQQDSVGRYVVMMDGQWRVRDIKAFTEQRAAAGLAAPKFGVCPLPPPVDDDGQPKGRLNAGWVNGNFFVIPSGARCGKGAWAFARFWIGMKGIGMKEPNRAANWYAEGGWIPVTPAVIESENFQSHLVATPLLQPFVELAQSPNEFPTPVIPGAAYLKRAVDQLAYEAMMTEMSNEQIETRLKECQIQVKAKVGR